MMVAKGKELNAEEKLLLVARSRWTRHVLEEHLLPALGGAVPLFATAQFDGSTIRLQTLDLQTQELAWRELTCQASARAIRFVQRLPHFDSEVDKIVSAELHREASDELRVAHHVMHSIDLPTTSLEVAHRIAHMAPDIAAALGRGLRFESQLRHVATSISFAAKHTAMLMSHMGLAVGFTCLVLNSMALHQAIAQRDAVATATLASTVILDGASCGLFTAALIVLALKAAKLAAILSTAALPASVAAFVIPPLVRHLWTKKLASEAACVYLASTLETLERSAVIWDSDLNALRFDPLVPISEINFCNGMVTLGSVEIQANRTFLLNAPRPSDDKVDVIETLSTCELQNFDNAQLTMVLPTCGSINYGWSVHFTAKSYDLEPCPGLDKVIQLKEKGFKFHNGLFAIHNIKTFAGDAHIKIILDKEERTLAIAPGKWFTEQQVENDFAMCYTFVGQGGRATIQLEERENGHNTVRLESSTEEPSTWVLRFSKKLNIAYYTQSMYIFTNEGINVVLTDSEKNLVYLAYDDIIYFFDSHIKKFVPKVVLPGWLMDNQLCLLEKLAELDCPLELDVNSSVDKSGKEVPNAVIFYDPAIKSIQASTLDGRFYSSRGEFCKGSLVLILDGIDLSYTVPPLDFNLLHKLAVDKLSVCISHMDLQGHFSLSTGALALFNSSTENLYIFSSSKAALIGIGSSFLRPWAKLGENMKKLSKSFFYDPVLALFPGKQRILAEHLQIADMHNMWLLPFEQKFVSAKGTPLDLELVECFNDSAILFDPDTGKIFKAASLPFEESLESASDPTEVQGLGKFNKFISKRDGTLIAFTQEGLVFKVTEGCKLELLEMQHREHETFLQMCQTIENVGRYILVPISDESGKILFFLDTVKMETLQAPEHQRASDCTYLGSIAENHFVFSAAHKEVFMLEKSAAPLALFSCEFAQRQENVLLLYDPVCAPPMKNMQHIVELDGLTTVIVATGQKSIVIAGYCFAQWKINNFILDPLVKTSSVSISVGFDEKVQFQKRGRDVVASCGAKNFIIHHGQRENFDIQQLM